MTKKQLWRVADTECDYVGYFDTEADAIAMVGASTTHTIEPAVVEWPARLVVEPLASHHVQCARYGWPADESGGPECTCQQHHEPSADALDAARYRWLRDDNAYVPEEECVRGGEDLDKLCDAGLAENPPSQSPPLDTTMTWEELP